MLLVENHNSFPPNVTSLDWLPVAINFDLKHCVAQL